jgi:hypothetical protein
MKKNAKILAHLVIGVDVRHGHPSSSPHGCDFFFLKLAVGVPPTTFHSKQKNVNKALKLYVMGENIPFCSHAFFFHLVVQLPCLFPKCYANIQKMKFLEA